MILGFEFVFRIRSVAGASFNDLPLNRFVFCVEEGHHPMSLPVHHTKATTLGLALRALGVIYGDIGTSPLYVVNTVFTAPPHRNELVGITRNLFLFSNLQLFSYM
jgi:hypothetical protein